MDVNAGITLLVLGAGIIIWFVRLEGRVNSVERQVASQDTAISVLSKGHGDLQVKIAEEMGRIRESLARIEGRLGEDH